MLIYKSAIERSREQNLEKIISTIKIVTQVFEEEPGQTIVC